MHSPGDFSLAMRDKGDVYVATCTGSPGLEGVGDTPLEALAALMAHLDYRGADSRDRLIAELRTKRRGLVDRLKST